MSERCEVARRCERQKSTYRISTISQPHLAKLWWKRVGINCRSEYLGIFTYKKKQKMCASNASEVCVRGICAKRCKELELLNYQSIDWDACGRLRARRRLHSSHHTALRLRTAEKSPLRILPPLSCTPFKSRFTVVCRIVFLDDFQRQIPYTVKRKTIRLF